MSRFARRRVVATICAGALVATAVGALAATKPKAGNWSGSTNKSHSAVTFTVSANRKLVTKFAAHFSYGGKCIFGGGAGGFADYAVSVPKMTISSHDTFAARVTVKDTFFHTTAKGLVSGKFAGTRAQGTLSVPGDFCPAPRKTALLYIESFTATRVVARR